MENKNWIVASHCSGDNVSEIFRVNGTKEQVKEYMMCLIRTDDRNLVNKKHFSHLL